MTKKNKAQSLLCFLHENKAWKQQMLKCEINAIRAHMLMYNLDCVTESESYYLASSPNKKPENTKKKKKGRLLH